MLSTLQVRNFALIENATIEFGEGLNILSGETGAGKSIIVQAIELLLGGRGSVDLIRLGEEEAEVTGLFQSAEGERSLRRLISRNGKGRAFLDERPVPLAVLEERAQGVVDLAGQHADQILLQPERHLSLLDDFAGLFEKRSFYQEGFRRHRGLLSERDRLTSRERAARGQEEFLRFQLKELSEAKVAEGEEERLKTEREVLRHAVRLGETCERGVEQLDTGEESITDRIAALQKEVRQAAGIDPEFGTIGEGLEEAVCRLQEASKRLGQYGARLSFDPERLQEVEDRLELIARLKKKYGGSIESLLQKEREIREELALLDHFEEEIAKQEEELRLAGEACVKSAGELSRKRGEAALRLSKEIEGDLKELGMSAARFRVRLVPLDHGLPIGKYFFNEEGCETGEFLIAPNPGEGEHPLSKIVSGGELSRIFLAIKKVLGKGQKTSTCIFDEVDSGIGGGIAEVVGRNLSLLSRQKQVICITHLPQIACYADHHFVIRKRMAKGRTETDVALVKDEEREQEIARMLAGLKITPQAIAHAREMLEYGSHFDARK